MSAKRPRMEKVERESSAIVPEQVEKLKELFPEAVSEGKVDFDKLRQTLGDEVDAGPERYSFTWAGKRDCIKLLQVPSRATLLPSPDESIDWDTTNNVFIEGENLEVLKLLYKAYYGRVKMVYIDPPYNTGNDFIYPDNYADPLDTYLRLTGQKDSEGNVLTSNPETSGRYHSSWLSMMYPRLFVAKQLLSEDGIMFASIDDHEVHNLRMVLDGIYGEENFLANIVWKRTVSRAVSGNGIAVAHDHIVCYRKGPNAVVNRQAPSDTDRYKNPDGDPRGPYKLQKLERTLEGARPTMTFPIKTPAGPIERTWSVTPDKYEEMLADNRIAFAKSGLPYYKQFLSEFAGTQPDTWWAGTGGYNQNASRELKGLFQGKDVFTAPKPTALLAELLRIGSRADSLVVDFFAGSATAAQAVLEVNRADAGKRRFICVQIPEPTAEESDARKAGFDSIADIGKERIRRVIAKMKKEQEGKLATDGPQDLGFRVYKLAESNMKPWKGTDEKDPEKYAKTMEMFLDPLVEGWKPENVIAEVALKEAGFGLNCRVEEVNRQERQEDAKKKSKIGPKVYRVTDKDKEQSFYICLDDKVRLEDVKFLNLTRDMLFVCRDVALDDETAANLALQCRLRTI